MCQLGDKQARRMLPSGICQLRIAGDVCARARFSVTKACQTDSNAKKPERLTVALRLCLHLGDWVVCSESDGVPPFFVDECGAAAAQYHPHTPTVLKQFR